MRGKVKLVIFAGVIHGITPAYAGKSLSFQEMLHIHQDHPRLCGEKFDQLFNVMCAVGSPPPMRGKGSKSSVDAGKYRITPAYAGKSTVIPKIEDGIEDHPRLCGEKPPKPFSARIFK